MSPTITLPPVGGGPGAGAEAVAITGAISEAAALADAEGAAPVVESRATLGLAGAAPAQANGIAARPSPAQASQVAAPARAIHRRFALVVLVMQDLSLIV